MIRKILIASIVFLSACVTPQPVDMAKVDPSDAKVNMEGLMTSDGTVVRCRNISRTGTRFLLQECKSESAWATWDKMVAANAKEAMDSVQRNRCSGVPGQCHPD